MQDVASTCKDKNIKIVTNAGGLNPQSMTNEIRQILNELNIDMKVAYIEGDNLLSRIEELQKMEKSLLILIKKYHLKILDFLS